MKIKTKLYIQATKYNFEEEFEIGVTSYKNNSDQRHVIIDIDETEIELECPNFSQSDFTNGHVDQLRKVKQELKAETHQKLKCLDEQIESLLAIENRV